MSKYLDAYTAAQFEHGYEQHSIRQQILVIADFSGWIEQQEIAVRNLDVHDGSISSASPTATSESVGGDPTALKRMLAMLREKGVVKREPAARNSPARVAAEFQRYLLQERGLVAGHAA